MLEYLLYIGDHTKTDLPYLNGEGADNEGYRLSGMMTPEAIVRLVEASQKCNGFQNIYET